MKKTNYSIFTKGDKKFMRNAKTGVVKPFSSSGFKVSKAPRISQKYRKRMNPVLKQKMKNSDNITRGGTVINKNRGLMMECFEGRTNLLDFTRKSYETYYNSYYQDNLNTPRARRIRIRGYRFYDPFNNQVARVEVESRNEKNVITIFEINPEYQGCGFGKDLLRMAETSFTANAAEIDLSEFAKIRFFERNGFIKMGIKKQTCILELDSRSRLVDRVTSVDRFDRPSFGSTLDREPNNELYHTGGYGYEGYRNYF